MRKDKQAEVTIRDLPSMNKKAVRWLITWLRWKADQLEEMVEPGKPWLVTRRKYARLFRFSLMK